jgi:hypothetical protein
MKKKSVEPERNRMRATETRGVAQAEGWKRRPDATDSTITSIRTTPASIIAALVAVWHHLDTTGSSHSRRRGSKPNVFFAFWFEAPRSFVP